MTTWRSIAAQTGLSHCRGIRRSEPPSGTFNAPAEMIGDLQVRPLCGRPWRLQ
jgi:hypothetical protein